ncbi:hypothetical protein ACHAWF_014141 [Thalassiosira exigua]
MTSVVARLGRLPRRPPAAIFPAAVVPFPSVSVGFRPDGRRRSRRPSSSAASSGPRLAHEWIVDGRVVAAPPDEARDGRDVVVFLHGLLGNAKVCVPFPSFLSLIFDAQGGFFATSASAGGYNLRTPAKRLTRELPHLNALLLDVRGHGGSSGSSFLRPHDFRSCVQDVFDTLIPLVLRRSAATRWGGGSRCSTPTFCAQLTATKARARRAGSNHPKQTWVLDCVPGMPDPSVHGVLRSISSLPLPIPSKGWVVETLTSEHGMNKGVAMWIASNLRDRGDGSFEWIFDLGIANELVGNFSDQDFGGLLREVTTPSDCGTKKTSAVRLVMAGKNKGWTEEIISELESVPSFRDTPCSSFRMHRLDDAGHWVHVDDLEGLLGLMLEGLRQ